MGSLPQCWVMVGALTPARGDHRVQPKVHNAKKTQSPKIVCAQAKCLVTHTYNFWKIRYILLGSNLRSLVEVAAMRCSVGQLPKLKNNKTKSRDHTSLAPCTLPSVPPKNMPHTNLPQTHTRNIAYSTYTQHNTNKHIPKYQKYYLTNTQAHIPNITYITSTTHKQHTIHYIDTHTTYHTPATHTIHVPYVHNAHIETVQLPILHTFLSHIHMKNTYYKYIMHMLHFPHCTCIHHTQPTHIHTHTWLYTHTPLKFNFLNSTHISQRTLISIISDGFLQQFC